MVIFLNIRIVTTVSKIVISVTGISKELQTNFFLARFRKLRGYDVEKLGICFPVAATA